MPAPDLDRKEETKPAGIPLRIHQIQDGLATNRLGKQIHYLIEVDSTNSHARRLAEQKAPEGEVVIAESQTHGRGRLGRPWVSPPYVNLYLSVILRPTLPPIDAPQITLMAAVALAESLAAFIPVFPAIKWPNDILAGGRKLAGILTESACHGERVDFVILGIGVNINYPVESMPDALRQRATSMIGLTGASVSRESVVRRLIQGLDRCYGELEEMGFQALAPRWEARFELRGKKVRVEMTDRIIMGTARGIDRDGALVLEDGRGELQRVVAGEVVPVRD
ncbi:MAG TPA: biotin--[acetyl-CoA-carboxylase] ligase [Candidatus Binatia bacterium]|jgi:BirA family transcriptional regulator, biotin operon repressor / biotin---[acetyl-CoA-carboxylase] ligase|nr:biotin--[acetyl-CoA-carboxylase] ligase [Candidatus Binatia bacterium]